ncbi:MAG: type I secretion system permease/ATPase [Burkholderiaceae bacterium]|nr:type I secretion system permease/ATPase [Burkholderiaceae bacterium]
MLHHVLGFRWKTEAGAANPLRDVLQQCRRAFWLTGLLTAFIEVLSVAPVLYMMSMFDRVMSSRSEVTLVSLTVLILAIYLFWSTMEWIRSRLMVRISMRVDWDLASATFDAAFRRYVGRRKVNVHQVLGDLLQVRQFLTGQSMLAIMSAPFALLFMVVGGLFHPHLAIFIFVASALLVVASIMTKQVTTPLLREANDAKDESNRMAAQSLQHAETALALGMQTHIRRRWYGRHQAYLGLQANASEAAGVMGGLTGFLQKAFPSLQIALGVYLAIGGLITGGMVMAATLLISKAVAPIQKLIANWSEIVNARQSFERLEQLLADDEVHQDRLSLPPLKGRLLVEHACAMPSGARRPVLDDISFTMMPGEVTAIVGPSAAGKSSLIRLLVGIWHPVSGSVRLDGASVADWVRNDLGLQMGYVAQDVAFLEGTVAENIARLGEVDADKVVMAAKLAGMHDTILGFPMGYETVLGEAGHALTGGQRQRLALARALYGSPKYLVMDEPNAALDDASERHLVMLIKALKNAGTTVIFSTHRPGLIAAADNLLVLSNGRQVGYGPVASMLAAVQPPAAPTQAGAPT